MFSALRAPPYGRHDNLFYSRLYKGSWIDRVIYILKMRKKCELLSQECVIYCGHSRLTLRRWLAGCIATDTIRVSTIFIVTDTQCLCSLKWLGSNVCCSHVYISRNFAYCSKFATRICNFQECVVSVGSAFDG